MICKAFFFLNRVLPKIRVIATLLAIQLVLQHSVCIVKFHIANFLTSTVCFQMPQGQFTKTKHKLWKLKEKKIKKKSYEPRNFKSTTQSASRVKVSLNWFKGICFLKHNKTKPQHSSIFNWLPVCAMHF